MVVGIRAPSVAAAHRILGVSWAIWASVSASTGPVIPMMAARVPSALLTTPGVLATDLDTEHGGTDANKRDGARRLGRLNVDDMQL